MSRAFSDRVIDALAEAQRYLLLDLVGPQVRADAIFYTLHRDDEVAAWGYEHAQASFEEFDWLCETGDYAAACELAEESLLPTLHDAAAGGRFDRARTAEEIRSHNPQAFRTVATVPKDQTIDWLRGRGHMQPVPTSPIRATGTRAAPPRTAARTRGAGGRPRARAVARAASGGGDSGDSEGPLPGGDDPPPAPGRLLHDVAAYLGRIASRPEPWALTRAERLPGLWRVRAARCRWREWWEGVSE